MGTKRGFAIVEGLIATIIVMASVLAIMGGIGTLSTQQGNRKKAHDGKEFIDSTFNHLASKQGCTELLSGQTYNPNPQTRRNLNLRLSSLVGGATQSEIDLRPGSLITPDLRVGAFELISQPQFTNLNINNEVFRQHVADINLSLDNNSQTTVNQKSLKISVLVDSNNIIRACGNDLSNQDVCNATHQVWDAAEGICRGQTKCEPMGTYIAYAWGGNPAARQDPRIGTVPLTALEMNNQLTGAPSCPTGNSNYNIERVYTSIEQWTNTVQIDNCLVRVPVVSCRRGRCRVTRVCMALDPVKVANCMIRSPTATTATVAEPILIGAVAPGVIAFNYMLNCLREYTTVDAAMGMSFVTCQRCPTSL